MVGRLQQFQNSQPVCKNSLPIACFRLRDKGMPELQSRRRGDLLIHVNVWTPKKLTDDERRIIEKLREMPNFNPTPGKEDRSFFDKIRDAFN